MNPVVLLMTVLVGGSYCVLGYFLIFKPERYLRLLHWSWKGFGVRFVVEDEVKFRKSHRRFGIFLFSLGIGLSVWLLWLR